MSGAGALWIAIAATVLGGLFSAISMSLGAATRAAIEGALAERGTATTPKRLRRILDDLPGHARAMALPRMVCNLLVAASVIWWLQALRGPEGFGFGHFLLGALVTALVLWVFSVLIPSSVASHAAARMVVGWAWLIRTVQVAEKPLAPLAGGLDELVRKMAGAKTATQGEQIHAELRSVITEGQREGQFDVVEREMIESVVEFRSTTVEQIMTPRTEVEALEYTNDLGVVTAMIRQVGHSRIPVYKESLDKVVGIFYVKDLMKWLAGEGGGTRGGGGRVFELSAIMRPAIYVPETKTVRELLRELLQKKVHIAMVADEFGGTAGLVTMEDIVEEVFGDIQDEYEPSADQVAKARINIADRAADLDARAYIDDVNAALRPLGVTLPKADDYDTLGGFVITAMGRIPEQGEAFRHERVVMKVLEATPTRVMKVRLVVDPAEGEEPPEARAKQTAGKHPYAPSAPPAAALPGAKVAGPAQPGEAAAGEDVAVAKKSWR